MPQNLELKISVGSLSAAIRVAKTLGARYIATLHQKDTYYRVKSGRLKLREIKNDHAELIYYRRANIRGGKYSQYTILPIENPKTIHRVLTNTLGTLVVVQKHRQLFLLENARLHFDRVEKLGEFVEFEVIVEHGKKQARVLFQRLCKAFEFRPQDSLRYSYSDLLIKKKRKIKK